MGMWESKGKSDEWYTPKYIFDALNCRFDMDVASPWSTRFTHVPTSCYLAEKSLEKEWRGFVWMNPPFEGRNGLKPWLDKFISHGNGIALTPDRTSAPWWQHSAKNCDAILFVNGKIKFIDQNGKIGEQPGNGTTLFAKGSKGINALIRAEQNGLGILFTKL